MEPKHVLPRQALNPGFLYSLNCLMKPLLRHLILPVALTLPVGAQVVVQRVFNTGQTINDNGQYVDVRNIPSGGMTAITDVNVGLVMSGAPGNTMRLGNYFVSLTYGTASENERVAVLLNRPQASDTRTWGSSLSSANLQFDDSGNAPNVFGITGANGTTNAVGTYAADGRLSVNPYATAPAYDASTVTHGLAALNGDLLTSNSWSLLVADTGQGGVGALQSWSVKITGSTVAGGTLDPGAGGIISDVAGGGGDGVQAGLVLSGTGAANGVTAEVATSLKLSGGLSGSGELFKTGAGKLTVSGDSGAFSGKVTVNGGEIEIASSAALGSGGTLALEGAGVKLRLSGGSSLGNAVSLGTAGTSAVFDGAGIISGAISGAGQLLKQGDGKIELSGTNTYSGQTTISGGILALNGTLTNSPVVVGAGGTLKGSGSVGGNLGISGVMAPGNSPGILTVVGTTTFNSGSGFEWELDTAAVNTRGVAYDGMNTGAVAGSGATFKVMLTGTQDFSDTYWQTSRVWTDIFKTADGSANLENWAGTFSGFSYSYASGANTAAPSGFGSFSLSGNTLAWSAVPEPGNVLAGLLAVSILLRRSRRSPIA
jgi:autotransporter-associated beta strand protein